MLIWRKIYRPLHTFFIFPYEPNIETSQPPDSVVLNCDKMNEVITVEEVLLGGVVPSAQDYPNLVPQQMTDECYSQWTDELTQSKSKKVFLLTL